eukprot:COSAG05_NODE_1080_length_5950_cov_1.563323_4_plen_45_part_00
MVSKLRIIWKQTVGLDLLVALHQIPQRQNGPLARVPEFDMRQID